MYPADWVKILAYLAELCAPYLKDFPGFHELGQILNSTVGRYSSETSPEVVVSPQEFSGKTRFLMLDAIDFPDIPDSERCPARGVSQFAATFLILTDEGRFASFDCRCRVYEKKRPDLDRGPVRRVFDFVQIKFLNEDSLLNLLTRRHAVVISSGSRIISKFSYLLVKEVDERQRDLEALRRIKAEVGAMAKRFVSLTPHREDDQFM